MKRNVTIICAALILAACRLCASAQTNTNNSRALPRPTAEVPKIIKFEGNGMKGAESASSASRPKAPPAKGPLPMSPAVLANVLNSLGASGAPKSDEHLLLTPRRPYVEGRGHMNAHSSFISDSENNRIFFEGSGLDSMSFSIKPAAVGQTYLIDITIETLSHGEYFLIKTSDTGNSSNTVGFGQPGVQHILLTFTSKNMEWQGIDLFPNAGKLEWYFYSCKVTLVK